MTGVRASRGRNRRRPAPARAVRAPRRPDPVRSAYDRMADRQAPARRRAMVTVITMALVPAAVLGVIFGLAIGWWVGLPVAALGTALGSVGLWRWAPVRAAAALPSDLVGHATREESRLHNLTTGLCALAGLPKPELRVTPDPGLNATVYGLAPGSATLVVTRGLLAGLGRIEMEGVVAHQLAHIRRGDALTNAVAALCVLPLHRVAPGAASALAAWLMDYDEAGVDHAAVALTRFPPGLTSALDKMGTAAGATDGLDSSGPTPVSALLWDLPPRAMTGGRAGHQERQAALREL